MPGMENRPDFSDYLAHFTTGRAPISRSRSNPTAHVAGDSARQRLESILRSKRILASRLPWNNKEAVCFTECPWGSLLDHARRYSPFGIGFNKPLVFAADGGPAYYVRSDLYNFQDWDNRLHVFVTPFWPPYRPRSLRENGVLNNRNVDYSHEREWRVPHDFTFEYDQIEFVILDTYEDMAQFPRELKDQIGREKFLLMENYRQVERLWPVHRI